MRFCILSLKRALRTVYLPILLALLALAVFFAPLLGEKEGLPAAGVCSADTSDTAARVVGYLIDNGFELCADEEALRDRIARGELNCGVIIPDDLEERMASGKTKGMVTYVETPSTFASEVYENHVIAALFREYAPYITAELITHEGITDGEVIDTYFHMMNSGERFTFDVEYLDGSVVSENVRGRAYLLGISSLLIFALVIYGVCETVKDDLYQMKDRIGVGRAIKCALLPSLLVRIILITLAFSAGIIASALCFDCSELLPLILSAFAYTLLTTAFAVSLAVVCRQIKSVQTVSFFILIAGLVVCPIYTDVTVSLPVLSTLRNILPPYWLWICDAHPVLMLVVAMTVLPCTLVLIYFRAKKSTK